MIRPKELIRALILPIVLSLVVLTLHVIWWAFDLPKGEELVLAGKALFERYGYTALFISAIIEGALVLGFYYPGGFIIFLSVVVAGQDLLKVATVVAIVSIAFAIGLSIDYMLGRYGWYHLLLKLGFRQEVERAQSRLQRHGLIAIFLTYWDINIASFTATAAGILRYPYITFLAFSILAMFLWNSLWAFLIYLIGPKVLGLVSGNASYALIAVGIWAFVIVIRHIVDNRRTSRLT